MFSYPYFLRTVPSLEAECVAITSFFVEHGFTRVGIVYTSDLHGAAVDVCMQWSEAAGIAVPVSEAKSGLTWTSVVMALDEADVNGVLVLATDALSSLFELAQMSGMLDKSLWAASSPTTLAAAEFMDLVPEQGFMGDAWRTLSEMEGVVSVFPGKFRSKISSSADCSFVDFVYDSVSLYAAGMESVVAYRGDVRSDDLVWRAMQSSSVSGRTGLLSLNDVGDRWSGSVGIYQMKSGVLKGVGTYAIDTQVLDMSVGDEFTHSVDLLSMNDYEWTSVPEIGSVPSRRQSCVFATHRFRHSLYLFGGSSDPVLYNDLYIFDTLKGRWSSPYTTGSIPAPREEAYGVFVGDALLVYGGSLEDRSIDDGVYVLDTVIMEWQQLWPPDTAEVPEAPLPRLEYASAGLRDGFVIYGGYTPYSGEDGQVTSDLWKFSLETRNWVLLQAGDTPSIEETATEETETPGATSDGDVVVAPPPLRDASMVASPTWDKLYLFGGADQYSRINTKTFVFSFETYTWEDFMPANTENLKRSGSLAYWKNQLFSSFGFRSSLESSSTVDNSLWSTYVDCPPSPCPATCTDVGFISTYNTSSQCEDCFEWTFELQGDNTRTSPSCTVYKTRFYCFGGSVGSAFSNALFELAFAADSESPRPEENDIHGQFDLPPARSFHGAAVTTNDMMWIFGGVGADSTVYNDLWGCSLSTGQWKQYSSANPPSARQKTAMVALGNRLLLVGGQDEVGNALGDVWMFTIGTEAWELQPLTFDPVYSHTVAALDHRTFWMYGGEDRGSLKYATSMASVDDWVSHTLHSWDNDIAIMLEELAETKANASNTMDIAPRSNLLGASVYLSHLDQVLYSGGMTGGSASSNEMFLFDMSAKYWVDVTIPDFPVIASHVAVFFWDRILIYGGKEGDFLNEEVFYLQIDDVFDSELNEDGVHYDIVLPTLRRVDIDLSSSAFVPKYRADFGGGSALGAHLAVHGGISGQARNYIDYLSLSDTEVLSLSPVCSVEEAVNRTSPCWGCSDCWLCAPGSYHTLSTPADPTDDPVPICQACPVGTYSDSSGVDACTPCPPGFFGPYSGARSSEQCFPCEEGSFAASSGSFECQSCSPGMYCPMAAHEPLNIDAASPSQEDVTSEQPSPLNRRTSEVSDLNNRVILAAVISSFGLFAVCIWIGTHPKGNGLLSRMDLLFSADHGETTPDGLMLATPNAHGGTFTIWYILLAVCLGIMVVAPYWMDNINEVRTLDPRELVEDEVTGALRMQVMFNTLTSCTSDVPAEPTTMEFMLPHSDRYGNSTVALGRECADFIRIRVDGIEGNYTSACAYAPNSDTSERGLCEVMIEFDECMVTQYRSVVGVSVDKVDAFSGYFDWGVEASSCYDEVSRINGTMSASRGYVFHGTTATNVTLSIIPSIMSLPSTFEDLRTGHLLDLSSMDRGHQLQSPGFYTSFGVTFGFSFILSSDTLLVERSMIATFMDMLAEACGLIGGIAVLLVTGMVYSERASARVADGTVQEKLERVRDSCEAWTSSIRSRFSKSLSLRALTSETARADTTTTTKSGAENGFTAYENGNGNGAANDVCAAKTVVSVDATAVHTPSLANGKRRNNDTHCGGSFEL
eukprot:Rmarinus@m.11271